jgi:hypothetical protein
MLIDLPFGPWLPDLPALNNPGVVEALNVLPAADGYKPLRRLARYSAPLNGLVRGGFTARDHAGNTYLFAGTADKLYQLAAAGAVDKSGTGYATVDDSYWAFAQWGDRVVAVNYDDAPQVATLGGGSFADLAGGPPRARHVAVVRNFLVLGNLVDTIDGAAPNRVRWSGFEDVEGWTIGVNQADQQDLLGAGGQVQRIVGGEYGVVFLEHEIWRMSYEGPPTVFRFDLVEQGRGTPCPGSVVPIGSSIFYIGQNGFYAFDGAVSRPIGHRRVDNHFFDRLASQHRHRVSATADPINKLVLWAYPSAESDGVPDRLIVYDWGDDRWSEAELDVERLFTGLTAGIDLEGLDAVAGSLDELPASLDSRAWTGGELLLAGFDAGHAMALFTGAPLPARLTTAELAPNDLGVTYLRGAWPITDGQATVSVGTRALSTTAASFGAGTVPNEIGRCDLRTTSRYLRLRVDIAGEWRRATSVAIDAVPAGRR